MREAHIFSPERKLHADYDRKGSVGKNNSSLESQGAWRQYELIDDNFDN
jgi:hypothetical protein